jgi:hypothetical protein
MPVALTTQQAEIKWWDASGSLLEIFYLMTKDENDCLRRIQV